MIALEAPRAVPPPVQCVPRHAWRDGSTLFGERALAEEVPVAFSYDGAAHAVLMATPDDLEDFALGFSYTEGIITAPAEIAELAAVSVADGIVLRMWLTGDRSDAFSARRRRFVGPAGCGMCGLESLAEANRAIPAASCDLTVSRQDIVEAVAALPAIQQLNRHSPDSGRFRARITPLAGLSKGNRLRRGQKAIEAGGRRHRNAETRPICLYRGIPPPLTTRCTWPSAGHAGAGGARNRAISDKMSANVCRETATSAIWNVT